jgi:hypothetical protein
MREYLDGILNFIGAESLTDEEFGTVTVTDQEDNQAVYSALLTVLQSRELVSDMTLRLQNYFLSQGIAVVNVTVAVSNILVGADLT